MSDLINYLRRRIQEDEDQQQKCRQQKLSIGIRLHPHIEQHRRQPQHKSHADHVPEVMPKALGHILELNGPRSTHRQLDQPEGRPDQQRIDDAEDEPACDSQRSGDP